MTSVPSWLNVRPNRGVAFAIHLVLSLLIFSSLVAIMLVYWFPGELFVMDGGWEGLKLVAMVDIILGPALTLILFKPGKPGLKLDLSLVAAVQIAALAYGFHATYNQRTVAVVFAENAFSTVSAADNLKADKELVELGISPGSIPDAKPFSVPLLFSPAAEDYGKYLAQIFNDYPDAYRRSDQYVTLESHHSEIEKHKLSAEKLQGTGDLPLIEKALGKLDRTMDNIEVYKFRARYANGYALYDVAQSRIIDYVSAETDKPDRTVAENTE